VAATATTATRVEGATTGPQNDMVALTVRATEGTYSLWYDINNDVVQTVNETTAAISFDASAEVVRQALQNVIAQGDVFKSLKFDVTVDRYINFDAYGSSVVYLIGFQGSRRQKPNGSDDLMPVGADIVVVTGSTLVGISPDAAASDVTTRMAGITYFGFEEITIDTGSGTETFNIQGTTSGSPGFSDAGGVAVTDVNLHDGDEKIFVSSNADLGHNTWDGFDFLTGDVDDVNGALNLDLGTGRHRLFISDEATDVGDAAPNDNTDGSPIIISDDRPSDAAARKLVDDAEIWITGLAGNAVAPGTAPHAGTVIQGGISFTVDLTGNLFDGVVVWTGSGDDTVTIDGTHHRPGEQTTTLLNTGLGNDTITVDLHAGADGFFTLFTSGGSATDDPDDPSIANEIVPGPDDDIVDASTSTLPLVIFGGFGVDNIMSGSSNDIVFGDFGRVQYVVKSQIVATHGFGGRGDVISSMVGAEVAFSRHYEQGGNDTLNTGDGPDTVFGGFGDDDIDAGTDLSRDVALGDHGIARYDKQFGPSVLREASSVAPTIGGNDTVTTGHGNDTILGGVGDDVIDAGQTGVFADVVVGDNGQAIFGPLLQQLRFVFSTDPFHAGDDVIRTGRGADIVIAGTGADLVDAGSGASLDEERDIVLGDNGIVDLNNFGQITDARTTFPTFGGMDYVLTGGGDDIIFGGLSHDNIQSGNDDDIVFGDHGVVIFIDEYGNAGQLQVAEVTHPTLGGEDFIRAANGDDLVFGGTWDDEIYGGSGRDILFGDHGKWDLSLPANQRFVSIFTGPGHEGGSDTIYGDEFDSEVFAFTTDFDDVILGGQFSDNVYGGPGDDDLTGGHNVPHGSDDGDMIDGGTGADAVLGDNGTIKRTLTGIDLVSDVRFPDPFADVIRLIDPFDNIDLISGDDVILGGANRDLLHGQRGNDLIRGGSGDDDILGGLGSDILAGDAGNDVVLGEGGQIVPLFNPDGSPTINSDGSWRRDVVLEDQGIIVDYIDAGVDYSLSYTPSSAARLQRADYVLVAGIAASSTTPWDTLLILINFVTASTNRIHGGDGNDVLFGGSASDQIFGDGGDDQIFGGLGNDDLRGGTDDDLIVGDDVTNSAIHEYLARVFHGIRLTADIAVFGGRVSLGPGGTVILPQAFVRPELFECAAQGLDLTQVLTGADASLGDDLRRSDGTPLPVTLGLTPNALHHNDRLAGNDVIDGGKGDDIIFGDYLSVRELRSGLPGLISVAQRLATGLSQLLAGVSQLALDYDVQEATQGGVQRFHPRPTVSTGNDVIRGDQGVDFIVGDNGILGVPHSAAVDEDTFVGEALEIRRALQDIEHLLVDVSNVVTQAQLSVLQSVGVVLHPYLANSDMIDATATPPVFGDEDPDTIVAGNANMTSTTSSGGLSPELLAAADAAVEADAGNSVIHGVLVPAGAADAGNEACGVSLTLDELVVEPVDTIESNPLPAGLPSLLAGTTDLPGS
jgi:Ca2+-binding RTX toxin-like protein